MFKKNVLAGGGKSYSAKRHAVRLCNQGEKVAYIQKSKRSIQQSKADIIAIDSSVTVTSIDSDGNDPVIPSILYHLNSCNPDEGEILIICENAFWRIPFWSNTNDWTLIFDEIPDVVSFHNRKMPYTHRLLADGLTATPVNSEVVRLNANDDQSIPLYSKNEFEDDCISVIKEVASQICSPKYEVCMLASNWHAAKDHKGDKPLSLHFLSTIKPSTLEPFKDVYILGALFDKSFLSLIWSREWHISFADAAVIEPRYTTHENTDVTLNYFFAGDWSKYRRDRVINFDQLCSHIENDCVAGDFIYQINKNLDHLFQRGVDVGFANHGLNNFQRYNDVVLATSIRYSPIEYSLLKSRFDITNDEIDYAFSFTNYYQTVMRSALRDPSNTEPKNVFVMDDMTAVRLKELIPNATLQHRSLPAGVYEAETRPVGRPALNISPDERQIRRKEQNRLSKQRQRARANFF